MSLQVEDPRSKETPAPLKRHDSLFGMASRRDTTHTRLEPIKNLVSDSGTSEIVGGVVDVLTSAFQVPCHNSAAGPQQEGGGGGDDVRVNIDPPTEPANLPTAMSPALLPRALWTVALLTLIVDVGTMLYKPPRGVVFGHHRLAYYLALVGAFAAGVAEAWTAFWISRSRDAYRRRYSFGRVVLCASIMPFVIAVAIGSFAFIHD